MYAKPWWTWTAGLTWFFRRIKITGVELKKRICGEEGRSEKKRWTELNSEAKVESQTQNGGN